MSTYILLRFIAAFIFTSPFGQGLLRGPRGPGLFLFNDIQICGGEPWSLMLYSLLSI